MKNTDTIDQETTLILKRIFLKKLTSALALDYVALGLDGVASRVEVHS